MEKNEGLRKKILSCLHGIPDTDESKDGNEKTCDKTESTDEKSGKDDSKLAAIEEKTASGGEKEKDSKIKQETVVEDDDESTETELEKPEIEEPSSSSKKAGEDSKTDSAKVKKEKCSSNKDEDGVKKKEDMKTKDEDSAVKKSEEMDNNNKEQKVPPLKLSVGGTSVSVGVPVQSPPTTTTSHLYSVLMAPLDSQSPYQSAFHSDSDSGSRKRMRLENLSADRTEGKKSNNNHPESKTSAHINISQTQGMDLSKNKKRKLKKKKRKYVLNKVELQRAKDFIYSSENEQYSVEKLRTMIEDVTEFLDAIWDVYCSEARLKGESVEEEGYKAAAVLKCISTSGEGSWGDLQLLSRAKSVLVLRSKNLAASTISRVENELGFDSDIKNFIVRMLRFWMNEVVPKG